MTLLMRELVGSRSLEAELRGGRITFDYLLQGSFDEEEVYAAVVSGSSLYYGALQRKSISLDHQGGGVWNAKVTYGRDEGDTSDAVENAGSPNTPSGSGSGSGGSSGIGEPAVEAAEPGPSDPLGYEFSFDTTGSTQHITQSRTTVSRTKAGSAFVARELSPCVLIQDDDELFYGGAFGGFSAGDVGAAVRVVAGAGIPANTTILSVESAASCTMSAAATQDADPVIVEISAIDAPDHQGAIGVSKDRVEGCDVITPKLEFSITRNVKKMTLNYIKLLRRMTGKTNSKDFFSFPAGELLFLGASGGGANDKPPRVTFKFAASENRTDIYISGNLTVPSKKGWDYLWVSYEDAIDDNGQLVARPAAAYVEEVYEGDNFKDLGI